MQSAPVVQALPPAEASPQPRAERAPVAESAAAPAAPVAPVAQSAPQEALAPPPANTDYFPAENTFSANDAPLAESAPLAASSPSVPDNPVLEVIDGMAWGAAGMVLLLALFTGPLRRRRPVKQPPTLVKPYVERPPEPLRAVPVEAAGAAPVPLAVQPRFAGPPRAVELPRAVPASFEERDALLKRMLDARPDRANPFRSRRARLKRARLILQSIGRKFERADPWIDLADYPNVWPELARRKHLQAA
ncbi:MAG TPA: hypothetical protein VL094_01895 [Sphingomonadaceae bacterium]|nr:hypothetical protein [Sphingomonadaceae bacterium]